MFHMPIDDLVRICVAEGFIHCMSENECLAWHSVFENCPQMRLAYDQLAKDAWYAERQYPTEGKAS